MNRRDTTEFLAAAKRLGLFSKSDPIVKQAATENSSNPGIRYYQLYLRYQRVLGPALKVLRFGAHTARKLKHFRLSPRDVWCAAQYRIGPQSARWLLAANLPKVAKPDVSIVIPVFNKIDYTLACLHSLALHKTRFSFEVVIIDNRSSDATPRVLPNVANLRYLPQKSNLGFVEGCNAGAAASKGTYIVFLNNDTRVMPGWLDNLVQPLQGKDIGMTVSKLVYPNGVLQEAGGIVFSDGSAWNYGKGSSPGDFNVNYVREVDYGSGASIALSAELFNSIEGFDSRYAPAYYEDTDLAFAVRKKGLKVVYQPHSVLHHYEGATAGLDTTSGMKRYQTINQEKFAKKWESELKKQQPSPKNLAKAVRHGGKKQVLVVDHIVPETDKDSGSVRMRRLLTVLQDTGYDVTFWPANLVATQPYTSEMQAAGIEVVYGKDIYFESFAKEREDLYDLVILSRPHCAIDFIDSTLAYFPNATVLFDTVDLHYLRVGRQAELEKSATLKNKAESWKRLEFGLMQLTDASLVVSPVEQKILSQEIPSSTVAVVPNIHVTEFNTVPAFKKRSGLMFIGNYQHPPNRDSVQWLAKEIMPLIWAKNPKITLSIIGSHCDDKIKSLATDRIDVKGFVEDPLPEFSGHRVFVSPLRYGAGVKGKIGQSFEFGLPVVTTDIGREGMFLKDGQNALVGNTAEEFADKVLQLYDDQELWTTLQTGGYKVLEQHFSNQVAQKNLEKLLKELSS